jgi:uncharacterized protein (TIGR03067 family)
MATVAPIKAESTRSAIGHRSVLLFLALSVCLAIGQPWISGIRHASISSVGTDDHREIQGTWQVVLIEGCGRRTPVEAGMKTVTFRGDAVELLNEGNPVPPRGSFVIDPMRKTIDLEDKAAPAGSGTYPGLYKLTSNRLSLCMARPGLPRPSDFETSPQNMHTLLVLERR